MQKRQAPSTAGSASRPASRGYADLTPSYALTPTRLLDAQELGEMIGFAPATLYRWRRAGRGPASERVDGRIMWRATNVAAWIEESHGRAACPPSA